jgi:hypothetical protein
MRISTYQSESGRVRFRAKPGLRAGIEMRLAGIEPAEGSCQAVVSRTADATTPRVTFRPSDHRPQSRQRGTSTPSQT